jgi:hypothetical protein
MNLLTMDPWVVSASAQLATVNTDGIANDGLEIEWNLLPYYHNQAFQFTEATA